MKNLLAILLAMFIGMSVVGCGKERMEYHLQLSVYDDDGAVVVSKVFENDKTLSSDRLKDIILEEFSSLGYSSTHVLGENYAVITKEESSKVSNLNITTMKRATIGIVITGQNTPVVFVHCVGFQKVGSLPFASLEKEHVYNFCNEIHITLNILQNKILSRGIIQ
jgi:hypothetical protein